MAKKKIKINLNELEIIIASAITMNYHLIQQRTNPNWDISEGYEFRPDIESINAQVIQETLEDDANDWAEIKLADKIKKLID